jgi:hypothetical protein
VIPVPEPGFPHHDEVAVAVDRHVRELLPVRRVRVDLELGAGGGASARVALAEDALAISVLVVGVPHHHEVPIGVGRDGLALLVVVRERVHLKLGSDGLCQGRFSHHEPEGDDEPEEADT